MQDQDPIPLTFPPSVVLPTLTFKPIKHIRIAELSDNTSNSSPPNPPQQNSVYKFRNPKQGRLIPSIPPPYHEVKFLDEKGNVQVMITDSLPIIPPNQKVNFV